MVKTVQESNQTEEEYFTPVSDVKCPLCGRFLLYDPREERTVENGQKLREFYDWLYADGDLEKMAQRDKYTGDELIWLCELHGPCHEGCDCDYHEKHMIPVKCGCDFHRKYNEELKRLHQ